MLLLLASCSTSTAVRPISSSSVSKAEFERALTSRNLDLLASYSSKEKGNPGALLNDQDREKARKQYEALRQEVLLVPAAKAALAPDLPALAAILAQPSARHFTSSERTKLETTLARYASRESPVPQYRTGILDSRVARVTAAMIAKAAKDPDQYLAPLVAVLIAGESDPFMRIKLIHDWISDTIAYDVAIASKNTVTGQDLATVLSTRRAVCSGYARLFQKMAELAGFEAKTVSGFTKGLSREFSFDFQNSHAWNMVRIGDMWYLVDTTFDAGAFQSQTSASSTKGNYAKLYSTDYLFPAPMQLRFTHFPEQAVHQLSQVPLDRETFKSQALVQPGFFRYHMNIVQPGKESAAEQAAIPVSFSAVQRTESIYAIDIEAPEDILVDGSLLDSKSAEILSTVFPSHISPTRWRIMFAIPKAGTYKAHIVAGTRNATNIGTAVAAGLSGFSANQPPSIPNKLESVMQFAIEGSKAYAANPPFPKIYGRYHNPAGELLESPMSGALKAGSTVHFEYHSMAPHVAIIYENAFIPLKRGTDGIFRLDFEIPQTKTIKLGVSEDNTRYSIVLAWDVR
ncbi:transglutaminase domain-containing protein [Rectinema subterraneum]|uniref:transglutaminase domain-containing protein n=1 Tax=Rectinema subterraneum TaxID=2653714 RepID=UPI003C7CC904